MPDNQDQINKTAAILLFLSEPTLYKQVFGPTALLKISNELSQYFTDSTEKELLDRFISGEITDEEERNRIIQLIESKTISSPDGS